MTGGLVVQAEPVKMVGVGVTPSSLVVMAQGVSYTFNITTTNTNPANSVISIVFPP